jgi:hypothetical protein
MVTCCSFGKVKFVAVIVLNSDTASAAQAVPCVERRSNELLGILSFYPSGIFLPSLSKPGHPEASRVS